MDSERTRRPGRVIGLLLILNLAVLAAGVGSEFWRKQARALPTFNADKVRLVQVVPESGGQKARKGKPMQEAAPAEEELMFDP